jgi:hypothetical protein
VKLASSSRALAEPRSTRRRPMSAAGRPANRDGRAGGETALPLREGRREAASFPDSATAAPRILAIPCCLLASAPGSERPTPKRGTSKVIKATKRVAPGSRTVSRQLLDAHRGKRARSFLIDTEVALDASTHLKPDDRHLQALATDAGRSRQLAGILRAAAAEGFVDDLGVVEQAHRLDRANSLRELVLQMRRPGHGVTALAGTALEFFPAARRSRRSKVGSRP